jgi:hypothetical protein
MHIGSGPGVAGASGMQVQPLVPWRSVFIAPFASTVTTEAACAIAAGAAVSALAIGSFELGAAAAVVFAALFDGAGALLQAVTARAAVPATSRMLSFDNVISPSLQTGRTGRLSQIASLGI